MFGWIKKIIWHDDDGEPILPFHNIYNGYTTSTPSSTHIVLEKPNYEVAVREAEKEIAGFEEVTRNILKDLAQNDSWLGYNPYFTTFEIHEVKIAKVGRIINAHIKQELFRQKVEGHINDKQ